MLAVGGPICWQWVVQYVDTGGWSNMLVVGSPKCWQWVVQYVGCRRSNKLVVGGPIC